MTEKGLKTLIKLSGLFTHNNVQLTIHLKSWKRKFKNEGLKVVNGNSFTTIFLFILYILKATFS